MYHNSGYTIFYCLKGLSATHQWIIVDI